MKIEIVSLAIIGTLTLLFGPLVMACIGWVVPTLWDVYLPWWWVFIGSCLTMIPLLFWTEKRVGSSYYTDAIASSLSDGFVPLIALTDFDLLATFIQNPRASTIGLVELSLWGPRQILEAYRKFRGVRLFVQINRHQTAQILAALNASTDADVEQLLASVKDKKEMLAKLAYLIWYGWIGVSTNGKRVWIDSTSQAKIVA